MEERNWFEAFRKQRQQVHADEMLKEAPIHADDSEIWKPFEKVF